MNRALPIILSFFFFLCAAAQDFNPKVINLPEGPAGSDFSFLKDELKDVQVVMLGEQTHFDGNVFEMKTEIIKYLYSELGFTTIAFESGTYDVWQAQTSIDKGENTKAAFVKSLFPIWSRTKEFQSFIAFFNQNKTALKVFGFDCQVTGEYGENLIKDLFDYCHQNKLPLKLNSDDLELLLESINNSGVFDEGDISYDKYKSALTGLLNDIDKKPKAEIHFYWKQIVKNLLSVGEDSHKAGDAILSPYNTTADDNIRDRQMADNLLAYIKAHPDEKIVCWGANAHFANNMASVAAPVIKDFLPMGSYIKNELKDKVYSLAAVTAADSIFLNNAWHITPLKANSFEQFLKSKNTPHLFVSSRQEEMKKPQLNRFFSPIDFIFARLDLLYDGYLYFNRVERATSIDGDENELTATSKINPKKIETPIKTNPEDINLDEIIIVSYNKKFTYSIINKAIEAIRKNYPVNPFSSRQYSAIDAKVRDETALHLNFTNAQYDRGYNQADRNAKHLENIRWESKGNYNPQSIRAFWSLSYNNPVMYGRYLNPRKSKKFIYRVTETKTYNNKKVFVVDFSIPRDHFTYTHRSLPSDFSGTLYINDDDYAIVKVIEQWDFKQNDDASKYDMHGWNEKYIRKEVTSETIVTNFEKINGVYYLAQSEIEISGNLYDQDNVPYPLQTHIKSYWSDFKTDKPVKIAYKDEQNIFEKVVFNKVFWDSFNFPDKP